MTKIEIEFLRESNAIEGVYDDTSLEQAKTAWKFLKRKKKLTEGVVLKTHKILMLHQPLYPNEKGYFRKCGVMVGGRKCPDWSRIPDLFKEWLLDVETSIKLLGEDGKHFRLDHITYEHIHPFVDGNGRTGRMFMNWQRLQAGLPILIIHAGEEQMEYYKWFKQDFAL